MASTKLTKSFGSAGDRTLWTLSFWTKRSSLSNTNQIFGKYTDGSNTDNCYFNTSNQFFWQIYNSGATVGRIITNRLFRDVSAWYHIVMIYDSDNATTNDRMRLYINGERETSFATYDTLSSGVNSNTNNSGTFTIGEDGNGFNYYNGLMAHVHFIDGTAYDASTFGETDATTGIWKPKTAPSVTYGTNGFFLKFENSGSMGTDSSGNANNFTVNGTLTQTVDTPSNVFATMNALDNYYAGATLTNGNNTVATGASQETYITSTLGVSSGKYYWEVKKTDSNTVTFIGITDKVSNSSTFTSYSSNAPNSTSYKYNGFVYQASGGGNIAYGNSYTQNDIIGVALDLDNNYVYFSKNGTWQNSGDPTSGATGTGGISISSSPSSGFWYAQVGDDNTTGTTVQFNFGNGYFGTTAVSSAQNPSDGIGIFEYTVPTGYKALCTKSINAQEYA
jgi:hypothetical protein